MMLSEIPDLTPRNVEELDYLNILISFAPVLPADKDDET